MRFGLRDLLIAVSLVALFFGGRTICYRWDGNIILGVQLLSLVMAILVAVWAALSVRSAKQALIIATTGAALAATLVALVLGVELAESLRRTTTYFTWRQDGIYFAFQILRQTILGALLGLIVGGIVLHRRRQQELASTPHKRMREYRSF
jgi:hypothetical protein